MLFYTLTIFLSAFLLFEVQPIIAKTILPWFGGTSAVWNTCMLFFQLALLLGYLYAHWLHGLKARRQAMVHVLVLAASLATLPILPNPSWKTGGVEQPSLRILALLAVTVGLPYFLLSSTSPLLQAWYARSHKSGLPYRLFALSNFASMLALLSYPALIEPNLPTRMQGLVWSAAYACFAVVCGVTAWRSSGEAAVVQEAVVQEEGADSAGPAPVWQTRVIWFLLAASASVLLLAVTTHLTQDVAAIPFLWILPLALYLLSFIICFESPRLYWRPVFLPLLAVALVFMLYRLSAWKSVMGIRPLIILFAAALFVCCMACHGELARLKPHPRYLTAFYVIVSMGGAAGGLFVGLLAPSVFRAYYEFPIGLALCAAVVAGVLAREPRTRPAHWKAWAAVAATVVVAYVGCAGYVIHGMASGYLMAARNFYGQLRVYDLGDPATDEDSVRRFVHGIINHGEQSRREEYRRQPITYFCPESGIGRAMRALEGPPRRIGILGLGCGTLAAYGRAGDILRIYEINSLVVDVARKQFTYLSDTPARVEVALGDGRLVLESESSQQFDILVMDAFSGDSVPVHLVTREAFETYFRHLKPGGMVAVNISNQYLNLEPVMERAAHAFGKVAVVYHYSPGPGDDLLCFGCSWTLIMDAATLEAHPELRKEAKILEPERPFRIWTDDFSNMYGILK